jgi:hypothetical protein
VDRQRDTTSLVLHVVISAALERDRKREITRKKKMYYVK